MFEVFQVMREDVLLVLARRLSLYSLHSQLQATKSSAPQLGIAWQRSRDRSDSFLRVSLTDTVLCLKFMVSTSLHDVCTS